MANKKISEFNAASSLTGNEIIPALQSGSNVKTTTQDIALFATAPSAISFSASIPFNKDYSLMNKTVDGTINFTANTTGRITGGATYLRLVADGSNTPTFDDVFNITAGSYDNTENMVNRIIFIWNGYEYEVSIAQLGIYDVTAPTVAGVVATNANTIVVTFSEAVTGTEAGWLFDNGSTLTIGSVTGDGTNTWTFVIVENMQDTDAITWDYDNTAGDVVDLNGNALAADSGSVTNSIVGLQTITFTTNESITSSAGRFTTTVHNSAFGHRALDSLKLASGNDGFVQCRYGLSTDVGVGFGFHTSNALTALSAIAIALYIDLDGTLKYNSSGYVSSGYVMNIGDYVRIKRTATIWTLETSPDAVTWTNRHTYGPYAPDVFVVADFYGGTGAGDAGKLYNPKGFNLS